MSNKQNKTIFRHLPNFITSMNLLAGSLAVIILFETAPDTGNISYSIWAGYLVFIAAILDFLDGMTARALHAYSEMGKQLDSLADLISFGLVPGLIAYKLLKEALFIFTTPILEIEYQEMLILLLAMLIPIFSGLRLAKFNVDTRQNENFIGLPTPANALFWASLAIIWWGKGSVAFDLVITDRRFLIAAIIILSFLLVSEIPMFSLKFKNFSIKDNLIRYIFLGISLILLIVLWIKSIPLIIITYIFISIIGAIIKKLKKK